MADDTSTGKKSGKKKTKAKSLSLNEFLAAPIANSTAKEAPIPKRTQSWADESEHLETDDTTEWPSKPNFDRTILPSAPRAATAVKVDLSRLPSNPPYTVYLGNLAYDCSEEDIKEFFQRKKVQVSNVRLPKEGTTNRPKGFGYAELGTRQDLEEALALTGESLKNRTLKIDLAGGKNQDESRGGGGSGGGYGAGRREYQQHDDDRTAGNWRAAPTDEEKEGDGPRRNDDSFNSSENRSVGNRDGGYRDGGNRDGGDRYSQQSRGYGEGGGDRRGGYGDRGGRRDGPSERSGPPGYGDRGRYGDRRPDGGRYEGGHEERRPREDDRRRHTPEREVPAERPKLQLVPRSKLKEEGTNPVATSSIFGGAKPVDTATREKEIEERLLKEKEEVKSPKDKAERSSIFGGAKPVDTSHREKEEVKSPKDKAERSSIFGGAKPVDTSHREREIEERLRKSQEREEVPSRTGEEVTSRTGEKRQSRLHSSEDEKPQTTEASLPQDQLSDSGTKKAWSTKNVLSTESTQHGTETKEGGAKGHVTYKVYLGNLSYECDTQDIEEFFEKRSVKVTSVRLPKDASTNRVRGFGYAELPTKEDLEHALSLDGEVLRGRTLLVAHARKDDSHGPRDEHRGRGERDGRSRGGSSSDDQHGSKHKEELHGRQGEERPPRSGDQDKRPPRENPWKPKSGPRSTSPPPPAKEKGVKVDTQEVVFSRPSRFAALDQDSSGDEHNED